MSTLFEKIECSEYPCQITNYPFAAYNLVQSVPKESQKKLILILQTIIEMTG